MSEKPILIIAAMEDVELKVIKEKLVNLKEVRNKICTFYEGEIDKIPVVLCVSGVGLVNAAASVTFGVEKYNPKVIINEGIAGGYGNNVHRGDIVVGLKVINITSYETEERKTGEGIKKEDYKLVSFTANDDNYLRPQEANRNLVNIAKKLQENTKETIHYGIIGSGDVWNKEADMILYLNNKYGIICEEMESASIYTISNLYNIPVMSVKGISNNEILDEKYDRSVGKKTQIFILKLIKVINDYI